MRQVLAITLLVFVLAGCSRAPNANPAEESKIRVAVFEYQMEQHPASVYFLSIGQAAGDPSDEIMQHFEGHVPPVKPASQGTAGAGAAMNDMLTGDTGIMLTAGGIEWISDTEVEVKGGYFANSKDVTGDTYRVVLQDGQWVVTKDTVDWKS